MANYQEQKEREYQNALVKRFQEELGYTYLGNWQYAKGANVNNMGVANSPILDDEVRSFLKEQGRTEMQIEDVLVKLKDKARLGDSKMSSLIQCNTDLYDTLIMGINERKWLATVIGGCMALMQSVTHRIGTEVASLVERYENTLPELTKEVSEYESEVNGYLAEMGFTL